LCNHVALRGASLVIKLLFKKMEATQANGSKVLTACCERRPLSTDSEQKQTIVKLPVANAWLAIGSKSLKT
jgi:hypothetical protein